MEAAIGEPYRRIIEVVAYSEAYGQSACDRVASIANKSHYLTFVAVPTMHVRIIRAHARCAADALRCAQAMYVGDDWRVITRDDLLFSDDDYARLK